MRETPSPRRDAAAAAPGSLRIAVLDRDSGFLTVLDKRLERAGWEYRVLASSVAPETIVPMRLGALVVDLAVIGPTWPTWLERLCAELPELGVVVCTGPSTVAQRVRGLRLGADDWLTKPCHPEELIARVESVVRRRRRLEATAATAGRSYAGEVEIQRDQYQAFVNGLSIDLTRREFELIELLASLGRTRARARVHLPAAVGLRDGARRPLGRRLRPQAAPEARARLSRLALHPHPLRDRLPLRRRAVDGGRGASCPRAGRRVSAER